MTRLQTVSKITGIILLYVLVAPALPEPNRDSRSCLYSIDNGKYYKITPVVTPSACKKSGGKVSKCNWNSIYEDFPDCDQDTAELNISLKNTAWNCFNGEKTIIYWTEPEIEHFSYEKGKSDSEVAEESYRYFQDEKNKAKLECKKHGGEIEEEPEFGPDEW